MQIVRGAIFAAVLTTAAGGVAAVAEGDADDSVAPSSAEAPAAAETTVSSSTSATTVAPPTTTATTTSTTTSTTTTTVPPPAPLALSTGTTVPAQPPAQQVGMPDAPPANPYEQVPVVGIGRIRIPKIGLDHEIYEGVSLTVIDVGPGHWPGTPTPGGAGNVVLGGHRVTHSHPFRDLDQLVPGDEIAFEMYDGTHAYYVVTEQFVVNPDQMWIVDPTPDSIVTLFACHPKGSARQRIVVRAAYKPL